MSFIRSMASMAAAVTLLPSALGAFDASSNSNMVVYWGQGPNQKPLSHFCADPNIDIINIGFLNKFPDQTGGLPGTNFGNQCGNETYKNTDGSDSPFLSNCPSIGPDIVTCQKAGKKVFLSLGGAIPSNQHINNDASAQAFARTLWSSFGPKTDASAPRPFGDAIVDGFDLDIESVLVPGEGVGDLSMGYSSLVSDLRAYFLSSTKKFYISGAPQCIIPDAHLADAIETSYFDFLFVQFYNTPECSARAYFDHQYGGGGVNISYSKWVDFVHEHGLNKQTKVYLGLPASDDSNDVTDPAMYLQPEEAKQMIQAFQSQYPDDFGGVMLYEATASETHAINGVPYADVLKKALVEGSGSGQSSSSSSAPSTPATSTGGGFPTIIPSSLPFGLGPPSSSGAPYPISSGSAPAAGPTGSSGVVVPSGSFSSKAGTAPYSSKIGTAPYSGTAPYTTKTGTAPSNSPTIVPSGASSGSLPSGAGSSSAPYPVSNSSSPISTGGYSTPSSTSGEEVLTETDVVTITSCGPEVTNCPAKTHPVVSTETHVSTIIPGSSGSVPAGGTSSTASTPGNSPESSGPGSSPQSTQEVVTTDIVTSYVTTCPVTSTVTSSGSQIVETGSTVSTVYSTIVSTICTKCTAPVTPVLTQIASPSAPVSESQSPFTGSVVPSASTQEVVTTVIAYTTLTTCPVTNTITSGTSEIIQVTQTVSTITSTVVSTICTKCIAPPTSVPSTTVVASFPGSGHQGPPLPMPAGPSPGTSSPGNTVPGSGHQAPPQPQPAGPSSENTPPETSSPGSISFPAASAPESSSSGSSSSPSHEVESGAQGGSVPSTPSNTESSSSSPASHGSESPAGSNSSPSSSPSPASPIPAAAKPAPAGNSPSSPESESGAQSGAAPAAQAPAQSPAAAAPPGPQTIHSTLNVIPVETLTIVPIPVSPSQTAKPKSPIESGEEAAGGSSNGSPAAGNSGSGAPVAAGPVAGSGSPAAGPVAGSGSPAAAPPFPASNGTVPTSPSGSSSPSQGIPSPAKPSVEAFHGAASRLDAGVFGFVAFVVAAVLIL